MPAGTRRTRNSGKSQRAGQRKVRATPASEWTWSAEPVHPALVTREAWEAAQKVGKEHNGVRDPEVPSRQRGRRYALRSRIHCAQCGRRMTGITRPGYHAPGAYTYTYYVCPWLKSNARDTRRCPEHVRASVREDHITTAISGFLDKYLLGHDRAAMLAGHLPKTAAEEAANRGARAAELTRRIARNEAAQKGLMTELAELGDAASPASTAYRQRIREHFNQLYDDTAALQAELDTLAATAGTVTDADLIAQLPYAPALLIEAPHEIREALCAALEVHCTYRADQGQVTIRATITDSTPGIVAALLAKLAADGDSPNPSPAPSAGPQAAAPAAADGTAKRSPSACADLQPAAITTPNAHAFAQGYRR
jgi:site-specific DNA recombinase